MSENDLKSRFDRDGFLVVPSFVPEKDLAELRQNLDRYIRDVVPTLSDADAFYEDRSRPETLKQMQRMAVDPFFAAYRANPRWIALAESLLGEPVVADEPEWFNKPPGTNHVTPPHQDNFYFSLKPPHVLTIWLALDPIDTENGCLRYVTASHQSGFRTHTRSKILGFSQGIADYGPQDFTNERAMLLQPGDAIIHHGMTIHRADANLSTKRHRRSFAIVFKATSCCRDEEAHQRYLASAKKQHDQMGLKT